MLAILLGRWGTQLAHVPYGKGLVAIVGPARRRALTLGSMLERVDGMARQWTAAGISLLVLAILLGTAMLAGR